MNASGLPARAQPANMSLPDLTAPCYSATLNSVVPARPLSLTVRGVFLVCATGGGMSSTRGDKLLTTAQAAERVGVKPGTIRSWASRGYLTAWGANEHGHRLYREERVVEVEKQVRERGLERMGIDPRRLRGHTRRQYRQRRPQADAAA